MGIVRSAAGFLGALLAVGMLLLLGGVVFNGTVSAITGSNSGRPQNPDRAAEEQADRLFEEGRDIFRFDTFGDEAFWGGALQLHRAIAGEKLGGVGPGVSPRTALAVGLKVDETALPRSLKNALRRGDVDLDDP